MCIFYWIFAAKIWEYMSFGGFLGALRAQGWEMYIFWHFFYNFFKNFWKCCQFLSSKSHQDATLRTKLFWKCQQYQKLQNFQKLSKILDIWCQHLGDECFYWIYAAVILRVSVGGMYIFYWIYAANILEYKSVGGFLWALSAQVWEMYIFLLSPDSSIGDLVTHLLTHWLTQWATFWLPIFDLLP